MKVVYFACSRIQYFILFLANEDVIYIFPVLNFALKVPSYLDMKGLLSKATGTYEDVRTGPHHILPD